MGHMGAGFAQGFLETSNLIQRHQEAKAQAELRKRAVEVEEKGLKLKELLAQHQIQQSMQNLQRSNQLWERFIRQGGQQPGPSQGGILFPQRTPQQTAAGVPFEQISPVPQAAPARPPQAGPTPPWQVIPSISSEGNVSMQFRPQTPHYITTPEGATLEKYPGQIARPVEGAGPSKMPSLTEVQLSVVASAPEGTYPFLSKARAQDALRELAKSKGSQAQQRAAGVFDPRYLVAVAKGILPDPHLTPETATDLLAGQAVQQGAITHERQLASLAPDVIQQRLEQTDAIQQIMLTYTQQKAYATERGQILAGLAPVAGGQAGATALTEAKQMGQTLPFETQQAVRQFENSLRVVRTVRQEFSEADINKYVGWGKFQAQKLDQFRQQDKKFNRFMVLNEELRATAFNYGGKQLTPFEASVVFGFTPTGRELIPGYYQAKLDELEQRSGFELDRIVSLARTTKGKLESPAQRPGPGEVKSRYQNMGTEDLLKLLEK